MLQDLTTCGSNTVGLIEVESGMAFTRGWGVQKGKKVISRH
jgi:hypothetical protein